MTEIPPDLRPKAYASAELFLDMLYALGNLADIDLESLAIYVCVGEATMRPLLNDPELVAQLARVEVPPDDVRGSITMLLVSDRLGFPRETVRRKVKHLISLGLVYEDSAGRVRTAPSLADARMLEMVGSVHAAVGRYNARLAQFGIAQ